VCVVCARADVAASAAIKTETSLRNMFEANKEIEEMATAMGE
jgi:hypothetical protein